jgi:hypothetical protein
LTTNPIYVSRFELVFCGWDGVWIGEGENEAIRMWFAVLWNRGITTKEESFIAANEGECVSFVVTVFVKICSCESISENMVWTKMKSEISTYWDAL